MRLLMICAAFLIYTAETNAADLLADADEGYGEYLSSECVACHNQQGSTGIPSIVGREAIVLAQKLHAYRSKELKNQVMRLVAGGLDDEQIASLAIYFSRLKNAN